VQSKCARCVKMHRRLVNREKQGKLIAHTSGAISMINESKYIIKSKSGCNTYTVIATHTSSVISSVNAQVMFNLLNSVPAMAMSSCLSIGHKAALPIPISTHRGIQKIILVGMVANTCVEGTARLGMELGYHVTLIKDAKVVNVIDGGTIPTV
jgi:hypothetical protein